MKALSAEEIARLRHHLRLTDGGQDTPGDFETAVRDVFDALPLLIELAAVCAAQAEAEKPLCPHGQVSWELCTSCRVGKLRQIANATGCPKCGQAIVWGHAPLNEPNGGRCGCEREEPG